MMEKRYEKINIRDKLPEMESASYSNPILMLSYLLYAVNIKMYYH